MQAAAEVGDSGARPRQVGQAEKIDTATTNHSTLYSTSPPTSQPCALTSPSVEEINPKLTGPGTRGHTLRRILLTSGRQQHLRWVLKKQKTPCPCPSRGRGLGRLLTLITDTAVKMMAWAGEQQWNWS